MIEISEETVNRVERILAEVPGGAQKALSAAMNRGLAKVRTAAFKEVRSVYAVQYGALKEKTNIRTKKASTSNLAGEVYFSGVKIPLYKFKVTPQAAATGAKVMATVQKGNQTEFSNAFIAMMGNGHIGVFERTGTQGIKSRTEQYKAGKHTEKLEEKMGLSVPQMVGNSDVIERVSAEAQETINTRVEHEIERILNGYGGGKK